MRPVIVAARLECPIELLGRQLAILLVVLNNTPININYTLRRKYCMFLYREVLQTWTEHF